MRLFLTASLCMAVFCAGCKKSGLPSSEERQQEIFAPLYSPQKDEVWIYEVRHEDLDGNLLKSYEKITHCLGLVIYPGHTEKCYQFDNYEQKKPIGSHYWMINDGGIYTAGYSTTSDSSQSKKGIRWLPRPFPFYLNGSAYGDVWRSSRKDNRSVEFRHLGEEQLMTPAGEFTAAHIQMNLEKESSVGKYDFWVVRHLGIVQERWWLSDEKGDPIIKTQVLKKHVLAEESTKPGYFSKTNGSTHG